MSSFKDQISILYKMRFMENEGDNIEIFEEILNNLSLHGTNDIIPDLCTVFEDDIAEPTADDYLIETIFYIAKRNGLEDGLLKLANGIPSMLPHAKSWAERMHRTLLNSEIYLETYMNVLDQVNSSAKLIIKDILKAIKEDNPKNLEKVNIVLDKLNYK